MLSDADRRQLDELGYLVLPDFVPPAMLDEMRERVEALWAEEGDDAGAEFLLGVRPFDVRVSRSTGYSGEVRLVEPLGDLTIVDIHAGGADLKLVLPEAEAAGIRHGDRLNFFIDAARAHLFRSGDGAALR